MEEITKKALEVVHSILKDFCEEEALAVIQIAKVLIEKNNVI